MITLNKLIKSLHSELMRRKDINRQTSPRAMSIRISRRWRRFDACSWRKPPLHLNEKFVENEHREDACQNWEREFTEREEHAADIIIDTALALEQQGCKNIEQLVKDRLSWRMRHGD